MICASALHFSFDAEASILTKKEAFEILQSEGFKWNLTKTLGPEAEAKSEEAHADLWPKSQLVFRQYAARINPVQYGMSEPPTIDTIGFGTTALEMSWSLMDFLAKAKMMTAEANERMTKAQAKHYQNELTALMLLQYSNVQRLHRQLDVMNANLNKSQLIYKLAMARKSVGAGIPLDIARAKNLVQLDQLKKIALYTKYTKARHELALLLSREHLDEDLEDLKPHIYTAGPIEEVMTNTLDGRSDLKAAQFGLDAATSAREETDRLFFPKLSVLGEIGSTQTTIFGQPAKTLNGFIGLSLSIPLETGGLVQAKKHEAAVLYTKADLQVKQTRAEIVSQVKEALGQLLAAEEALHASDDYLKTAEEEAQIAENRYRSGASNILDATTAHTNFAAANDTRIENVFNYEVAKINYFRTRGDFREYFEMEKSNK